MKKYPQIAERQRLRAEATRRFERQQNELGYRDAAIASLQFIAACALLSIVLRWA